LQTYHTRRAANIAKQQLDLKRQELDEKQKRQSLTVLNQTFKEWATAQFSINKWTAFSYIYILKNNDGMEATENVEDLPYFSQALQYLRENHLVTYENWERANKAVKEYNLLASKMRGFIEKLLEDLLKTTYPNLVEYSSGVIRGYYSVSNIAVLSFSKFELEKYKDSYGWFLSVEDTTLISSVNESDVEPNRLEKVLHVIRLRPEIVRGKEDLMRCEWHARGSLEKVCKELELLSQNIDLGLEPSAKKS
jgi:hypothetical protein